MKPVQTYGLGAVLSVTALLFLRISADAAFVTPEDMHGDGDIFDFLILFPIAAALYLPAFVFTAIRFYPQRRTVPTFWRRCACVAAGGSLWAAFGSLLWGFPVALVTWWLTIVVPFFLLDRLLNIRLDSAVWVWTSAAVLSLGFFAPLYFVLQDTQLQETKPESPKLPASKTVD